MDKKLVKMDKKEFDRKIFKDFPKLFKNRKDPMRSLLVFGVECSSGWYPIIYDTIECINQYAKDNPDHVSKDMEIVQIKEKFGSLRLYLDGGDANIYGMIWLAEHLSGKICERCGEQGILKEDDNWWTTLCDKCRKTRKEEMIKRFNDYKKKIRKTK